MPSKERYWAEQQKDKGREPLMHGRHPPSGGRYLRVTAATGVCTNRDAVTMLLEAFGYPTSAVSVPYKKPALEK